MAARRRGRRNGDKKKPGNRVPKTSRESPKMDEILKKKGRKKKKKSEEEKRTLREFRQIGHWALGRGLAVEAARKRRKARSQTV